MIKAYENQQKVIFEGAGEYDIPEIEATNYEECDFISFNKVLREWHNKKRK